MLMGVVFVTYNSYKKSLINLAYEGLLTMSEKDVVALTEFGLTVMQAKAYVALLAVKEASPSQLCKAIGVVRPEAYRVLHELSAKGLADTKLGFPVTYCPVDPERVLSILTRRHEDALVSLKKKRKTLLASLASVKLSDQVLEERFVLIAGGKNAQFRITEMIRKAKDEYLAVISKQGLRRWNDDYVRVITSARNRKCNVRMIAEADRSSAELAEHLSRVVRLRTWQPVLFYMDIVDRNQMMFGPAFPANEEELEHRENDLWTNNLKFVQGMCAMFESLWKISRNYVRMDT
jgi:sugar-specific transcriptional regulator TrmB